MATTQTRKATSTRGKNVKGAAGIMATSSRRPRQIDSAIGDLRVEENQAFVAGTALSRAELKKLSQWFMNASAYVSSQKTAGRRSVAH